MSDEQEDSVTEQEMFDSATQPRDEAGRFASQEPEPQAEPEPEKEPETPEAEATPEEKPEGEAEVPAGEPEGEPEEKPDHRVPLTEHLSEREKRQTAERERDEFRKQTEAFQQQINTLRQQMAQAQAPKQEPVDLYADPDAWRGQIERNMQETLRKQELNFSMRIAKATHSERFDEAYDAFLKEANMNPQFGASIVNSPDPGEAIVQWHKRESLVKEVGEDPAAYKQRVLDEALNDQEFIAKAMEKARAGAEAAPQNNVTNLPPSLTKASGGSPAKETASDLDDSEKGVFDFATRA